MRAADVEPRPVEWLWHPYLPLGKISMVAGQMGQAKSLLTCWLAAYTTTSGGSVVTLSAEDDPADTIRPRLEAAGADLARVEISSATQLIADELADTCDLLGDVKLITVDPVQAYMPSSVNSWKGQDVRLALEPIRRLAGERGIAVVVIQHLNRRADGDPLARIADSQGVPQLARSVMIWGPDPSDPEGDHGARKVLTRVKGNLARGSDESATFTIAEHDVSGGLTAPALARGADARITASDVIADADTRTAQDEAADWLEALLTDGPIPAKDGQRRAHADGIAERTLKRAKAKLGVISEPSRDEAGIRGWTWRLPHIPTYTPGPLDTLGTVGPLGRNVEGQEGQLGQQGHLYDDGPQDADAERITAKSGRDLA